MNIVLLDLFFIVNLLGFLGFQFKQAEETAVKLDLDGLVVIGGDDSNTNACLLAENFRFVQVNFINGIIQSLKGNFS